MVNEIVLDGVNKGGGFKEYYEHAIERLLDFAPSDSSVASKIVKKGRKYFGVLKICSTEGIFRAQATSAKCEELAGLLLFQMRRHIQNWGKTRFLEAGETRDYRAGRVEATA